MNRRMLGKGGKCITPSYSFWTPVNMVSGLEYWFDSANTCEMSIESDNQSVNTWNDQSGNARNVTAFSSSAYPKANTDSLNGYNVIDFTPSGTVAAAFVANNSVTITQSDTIVVFAASTGTQGAYVDSYSTPQHVFYNRGERLAAGALLNAGTLSGLYRIQGVELNGVSSKIYSDAVQVASGNTGTNSLNGITIGRYRTSVGASVAAVLTGQIGDVIVFSGVDTSKRQFCEGYLSWKWAGDGSYLPIGHPYKSTAPSIP
jgi:hypothetical protein